MTDWSALIQQHGSLVWKTVFRLVSHDADAADCFQNTFVAALEFSRQERVHHWPGLLKHLATMKALERLRQRYRTARLEGDSNGTDGAEFTGSSPEHDIAASELTSQLRLALAELEPRQAQVFCLCCLEESSYQEVAIETGLTVNHVGVLLNRAKASLRERLKAFAPAES
ncbi:MAG: sigE 2 [Planctomycetaceae bacterium]|nr:sigE 2 [Planctomycetaceae bacterium]